MVVRLRPNRVAVAVVGAGCLVAVGCSAEPVTSSSRERALAPTTSTTPSDSGSATRSTSPAVAVRYEVGSGNRISGPGTLRPGPVRIDNAGERPFYLYRSRGSGLSEFVRDVNSDTPDGLLQHFFQIDRIAGKSRLYARLVAGTYYAVDADAFPIEKKWVATIKVAGSPSAAAAPTDAQPISIGADDKLTVPAVLTDARPVRVAMAGSHGQVIYLFRLGSVSKKTVDDFLADPDPDDYDTLKASDPITLLSADGPATITKTWRAKPGQYVIVNTAYKMNGDLVFERGQARRVTVR